MKLLLLTRHYPPAVSGGAKRPFLLARALREAGVEVRVCAPSLPDGEPGWAVPHAHRDPSTEGGPSGFSLSGMARGLLLWPDPDIRWCLRAAETVVASGWKPDWVLSTSPPESIHVAGQSIARRLGARWAADFRDLWLTSPHRRERLRLHRRIGERLLARRLLPRADLVLAVDPVVAKEAEQLGARSAHVLAHFTADDPPVAAPMPDGLNVVHAGSIALSDPDADIRDLLAPFESAIAVNAALRLIFVGRLLDREREAILRSPAAAAIEIRGPKPLDEALAIMAGADALAFVASNKMHVPPSKIVDYLQVDRPIIACGSGPWRADPRVPEGDPAQAMAGLRRGDGRSIAVTPPTARDTARQLLDLLR
jgi:glycosyltransferase involved in cell wall biosynthesis